MPASRKPVPFQATAKWLSIVGIGEDGAAGLGEAARRAVEGAAVVFGAKRHLELAAPLIRGEARAWPVPFDASMAAVTALRDQKTCVLASGDPFHFGVGATLSRSIDPSEMETFPAPSAFSLGAARLGWALQDTETVSLHGRPLALLRPLLHPGRRILALTSGGGSPAEVAALLTQTGFGASRLHVLEALGGPDERQSAFPASEVGSRGFDPLNLLGIEVAAEAHARILPLGAGLADSLFEHDGQITKREIRAPTLAALAPRRGELLWDVGAGSGSIGIAWMLTHPSLAAVAVEGHPERAERIRRNAESFGVPGLKTVCGSAPEALAGLPPPDAIFLGGGGSDPGVADAAIAALKPGGRLVANAVTLEMEALLLSLHANRGGELCRLAVSRAAPVGGMTGWRPAMPVTQWSWTKP